MTNRKRLFFDLETSMLLTWSWRTGKQYVGAHQILEHTKIISAHWSWEGSSEVHHIHWGLKKQCDKRVVKKMIELFDKSSEIIAHNGDRFDMQWIRSRAAFHGLDMNPDYKTIDTYKLAKYNLNLPAYSLKEICKYYSLPLKLDAGGVDTWKRVQFDKDKEALNHLLYYGDGDIVSLKAVFEKLRPYVKHKTHYGVLTGSSRFHCPNCGKLPHYKSMFVTAAGTVQHRLQCSDRKECRTQFKINNATYQKYFQYRLMNGIK